MIQNVKINPTKTPNHIWIGVVFMLFYFSLKAQVYIHEDLIVSFDNKSVIMVSSAKVNQINSSIQGSGVFMLNASHSQNLKSSKSKLHLSNLRIKNADLVTIEMVLEIQHTLIIDSGTLTLSKDLYLEDSAALQTFGDAGVLPSTCGQLVYKSQRISNHFPLVVSPSPLLLTFVAPSIHRVKTTEQWPLRFLSNFENVASYYHTPFLSLSTPPPKHSILV